MFYVIWTLASYATQVKCLATYFGFNLLTHKGSPKEVYRDFQPSLTSSAGGAKGCLDHRFRAPPAYTTQLLTNLASTQSQQTV